jgi:hypothetical protein
MTISGMWRRVVLVCTDISEERIASIFRVENPMNQSEQVAADSFSIHHPCQLTTSRPTIFRKYNSFPFMYKFDYLCSTSLFITSN